MVQRPEQQNGVDAGIRQVERPRVADSGGDSRQRPGDLHVRRHRYSVPEKHGDRQATADAIRAAVLTQRRGLDLLTTWVDPPPDRLCYFGHSYGAFMGCLLSSAEPRLSALALASFGVGTLRRLAAESMPTGPASEAYLESLDRFDPAPYVAVPGRRRLLFQHGREDPKVLRSEALALAGTAAEPREFREYATDHDTTTPPEARADRLRLFTSAVD